MFSIWLLFGFGMNGGLSSYRKLTFSLKHPTNISLADLQLDSPHFQKTTLAWVLIHIKKLFSYRTFFFFFRIFSGFAFSFSRKGMRKYYHGNMIVNLLTFSTK